MNSQSHTFWERLEAHHKGHGIREGLCRDWVFNERWDMDEFRKQKERVLFVLKETNGPVADLMVYLEDKPLGLYWNVARWAYGILNDFPPFEKIPDGEELKQYLMKVAVINIKKTPGEGNSEDPVIRTYARQDREFLLEQIRAAQPTMIVACGTIVSVIELLDLAAIPEKLKDAPVEDQVRKAWVIPMQHPRARTNLQKNYENLKKRVRRARTAE